MNTTKTTITFLRDLSQAEKGSYYTILGAGGDLDEWVTGYEQFLDADGCGKPTVWYETNGAAINEYAQRGSDLPLRQRDRFPEDLTVLLFPLDGLHPLKLPLFKVKMQDRWFDDVVQNMRRHAFDEGDE